MTVHQVSPSCTDALRRVLRQDAALTLRQIRAALQHKWEASEIQAALHKLMEKGTVVDEITKNPHRIGRRAVKAYKVVDPQALCDLGTAFRR